MLPDLFLIGLEAETTPRRSLRPCRPVLATYFLWGGLQPASTPLRSPYQKSLPADRRVDRTRLRRLRCDGFLSELPFRRTVFFVGLLRVRRCRTDPDDSANHVEAPPGLFFDSRRVTLDDSADSAVNSLHLWTSALIQHCHPDTLTLVVGIRRR